MSIINVCRELVACVRGVVGGECLTSARRLSRTDAARRVYIQAPRAMAPALPLHPGAGVEPAPGTCMTTAARCSQNIIRAACVPVAEVDRLLSVHSVAGMGARVGVGDGCPLSSPCPPPATHHGAKPCSAWCVHRHRHHRGQHADADGARQQKYRAIRRRRNRTGFLRISDIYDNIALYNTFSVAFTQKGDSLLFRANLFPSIFQTADRTVVG